MRGARSAWMLLAPGLLLGTGADRAQAQAAPFAVCFPAQGPPDALCLNAAQAFESAYPQVGILMTGGSAPPGTASTAGIRLGILPGVSATASVRGAGFSVPDVRSGSTTGSVETFAPAVALDASAQVFSGFQVAPTLGGVGSVELLAGLTWMPLETSGVEGFESNPLGFGGGVRIGLLRESFTAPALALSAGYRQADGVRLWDTCDEAGAGSSAVCDQPGDVARDPAEVEFDVRSWSFRGTVAKRLAGVGLTGGVGYDAFSAEGRLALRVGGGTGVSGEAAGLETDDSRWSFFAGASRPLRVGSVTLEAGWMQGGDAVPGFVALNSDHDPGDGTFFGSLSGRVHL